MLSYYVALARVRFHQFLKAHALAKADRTGRRDHGTLYPLSKPELKAGIESMIESMIESHD